MIVLVHGIRNSYDRTVGQLVNGLQARGHDCKEFEWGPENAIEVAATYAMHAIRLAVTIEHKIDELAETEPVHLVGHSAGGLIITQALKDLGEGYKVGQVFLIAPAMSRREDFSGIASKFGEVHCFHNCLDLAVIFGAMLPWHPFGLAGVAGFKSADNVKIFNHSMLSTSGRFNHSENWFSGNALIRLAQTIASFADFRD